MPFRFSARWRNQDHAPNPLTIIAKIEHPQALDNLEAIMHLSWGVMVARGDLGVEFGVEKVPALQKQIIRKARQALKPVITATQMLESMIENSQPTRAEASDVANAIWDGTDAVMLSAESAVGKHPLEAVRYLDSIAADADAHYKPRIGFLTDTLEEHLTGRTDVSVAFAACRTAEEIGARLIVVFTEGGGSARLVSRLAADIPVIGATTDIGNARRMGLLRGVESLLIGDAGLEGFLAAESGGYLERLAAVLARRDQHRREQPAQQRHHCQHHRVVPHCQRHASCRSQES